MESGFAEVLVRRVHAVLVYCMKSTPLLREPLKTLNNILIIIVWNDCFRFGWVNKIEMYMWGQKPSGFKSIRAIDLKY